MPSSTLRVATENGYVLTGFLCWEREKIGADILGQLGWSKKCFHAESVSILITFLNDDADDVISSAAFSLGHRNDPCCVPELIKLIDHKNSRVRHGVAFGLSCLDDDLAISALIKLSRDFDYDVRNWATFGLGSLCDMDSEELRKALFDRIADKDPKIRGEALVGLARRKDKNIKDAIKKELSGSFYGNWAVEAAELMEDHEYYPFLCELRERLVGNDDERFLDNIDDAITACCKNEAI